MERVREEKSVRGTGVEGTAVHFLPTMMSLVVIGSDSTVPLLQISMANRVTVRGPRGQLWSC